MQSSPNLNKADITIKMENRHGELRNITYHGYLFGLMLFMKYKTIKEYQSIILVTGPVGDGKSTLVEGLAGLSAYLNDTSLTIDDISWSTESFINNMDREDNIGKPLWWDEAISGGDAKNMAISKVGRKLKISVVTKRFKRHVYFLIMDNLSEFSERIIDMADAWIHVNNYLLERGRFYAYSNKSKISFLHHQFKKYKRDWNAYEVRKTPPDKKGRFYNYQGFFIDPEKYNQKKFEETKQNDEGMVLSKEQIKAIYLLGQGMKVSEIAKELNKPRTTVSEWKQKFKTTI